MGNPETIVISLGGSIIVPDQIDVPFLEQFRSLIQRYVDQGFSFVIIAGGGSTARKYIRALEDNGSIQNERKDWVGIYATRLNAQFVNIFFKELTSTEIFTDPNELPKNGKKVVIGGGWKPGASTDHVAVHAAGVAGAKKVINLSNIKHVYDSDPAKNPSAKRYEKLDWDQYRSFIPSEWEPGLSTPFDPIASLKASELGLEVAIMDGRDLENLADYLDGKDFKGTIIK